MSDIPEMTEIDGKFIIVTVMINGAPARFRVHKSWLRCFLAMADQSVH